MPLALLLVLAACQGTGDPDAKPTDADKDGYDSSVDCDDSDPAVHPGADEVCDGVDDDCDGYADGEDALDAPTWYADADGDGHGEAAYPRVQCDAPTGFVASDDDCDDGDAMISPDGTERCDGVDDDCDGEIDEDGATGAPTWFRDEDGDGYGLTDDSTTACEQPSGYAGTDGDCDDTLASVHPGATERWYDGVDQDCDGASDYDADADHFESADYGGDDCDDTDEHVRPGARETCDGIDQDCDGEIDEEATDATAWYPDDDGDGYGADGSSTLSCDPLSGATTDHSDCDDTRDTVNPGASEVCGNGLDDDCDGTGAGCGPYGTLSAGGADARLTGESGADKAGIAVAAAGDVDGDGLMDMLVGAHGNDTTASGAGAAYLLSGPVSGRLGLADATAILLGQSSWDQAGNQVAGAGDLDQDGYDDVLVGARYSDLGGTNSGAAYVVMGPLSGSTDLSDADGLWQGAADGDYAGAALAAGQDADGDGLPDLLIGSPRADGVGTDSGAAYLLRGPATGAGSLDAATAWFVGEAGGDSLGQAVAFAGDLDGDGVGDVLIGAPGYDGAATDAGAVYFSYGPLSGLITPDGSIDGESNSDELGSVLATGCDLDGDGTDDLVIGAPYSWAGTGLSEIGVTYVVSGDGLVSGSVAAAFARITGEKRTAWLGAALSCAGDVDADGQDDLLIGSPGWDSGASTEVGAAYLFLGPLSGGHVASDADGTMQGAAVSDSLGTSVAGLGDTNGDGWDDLLVGAPDAGSGSTSPGEAWLFVGGPGL